MKAMRIAEDEMFGGSFDEVEAYSKAKEKFIESLKATNIRTNNNWWADEPTVYRFGHESFLIIGKTVERIEYIKVRNAKC